jgi:DNA-binding MarR family transcriptional regulator
MLTDTRTVEHVDLGLTRLHRLWESPEIKRRFLELLGRPVELSLVRTLRAIERCGLDEPGVSDLAGLLNVDTSTASRFVEQATAGGYVRRDPSERDRRRCVVRLTGRGAELLAAANVVRATLLEELLSGWPDEDVAAFSALLERFADSVAALESRP